MTDVPEAQRTGQALSGKLFLYRQPELLTPEDHSTLGVTPSERPYEHASAARAIPLTMTEFSSAQRHYPIVFASLENPYPLAVVAVLEDENLFVDDGIWDPACYVPSYLRCYPFSVATAREGQVAVVVDRAAAQVTENPQYPFFADGKITKETESMMRFCGQYEAEGARTSEFCKKLAELNLLTAQRATYTPDGEKEEQTLANYVSIDSEKLTELDAQALQQMHKSGQLSAAYMQLYSMQNWRELMVRRGRRRHRGAPAPAQNG